MMMIERRLKIFWLMLVVLMALENFASAAAIPTAPTDDIYVADYASMIESAAKNKMLKIGGELDDRHRAQIVAVTIETLDGESIEAYANRLFNNWGIGDLFKDNGVLLLIAKNDRQFRIEVGYGLESTITNDFAASVLDGMKDQFRAENYSTAILSAYAQLARKIYEHYGEEPPESLNTLDETPAEDITWGEVALAVGCITAFVCSIALTVRAVYRRLKTSADMPDDPLYDRFRDGNKNYDDHYGGGSSGGGGASGGW